MMSTGNAVFPLCHNKDRTFAQDRAARRGLRGNCECLVRNFTPEGAHVLDAFSGSGRIPIAVARLGRSVLAIDSEAKGETLANPTRRPTPGAREACPPGRQGPPLEAL